MFNVSTIYPAHSSNDIYTYRSHQKFVKPQVPVAVHKAIEEVVTQKILMKTM